MAKKSHVIGFISILAICMAGINGTAGELDNVRESTEDSSSSNHDGDHNSSSTDAGVSLEGDVALAIILSPFWLPHILAEEKGNSTGYFTDGPYQKSGCGYMQIQEGENWYRASPSDRPDMTSPVSLRLGAEYSYDFDNIHKPGVQLFWDTYTRLGLESSWTNFYEQLDDNELDTLTIGDLNLTFRFAQNQHVQFYAGAGSRLMIDHGKATFGVNFTYGIDIFPVNPLIISLVGDFGSLGKAFVSEARATVGVALKGWEIYGGYDILKIDDVRFHGPILGFRAYYTPIRSRIPLD